MKRSPIAVYRTGLAFCRFAAMVLMVWSATTPAPQAGATALLLARGAPVRIMALGDSITAGVGAEGAAAEDGGYRGFLGALLEQRGFHATFVGSRADYSERIRNRRHEGWPGYVLRSFPSDSGPGQLLGPTIRAALADGAPDLVLLMAGTNDLLRLEKHAAGYTLPNIVESMNLVIGEILTERPQALVIVAPVVASPKVDACTMQRFAGVGACADGNVASARTLVEGYQQRGFNVAFAPDMLAAVPADAQHFPDGIHPCGSGGYEAIANVWFAAIERLTQPAESGVVAGDEAR